MGHNNVIAVSLEEDLFKAVCVRDLKWVRWLLKKGVNPNERHHLTGDTPLHTAVSCEDPDARIVRLLLEHGADPNARDRNGRTPLHYAAIYGHYEIVKLLTDFGADPCARDSSGRTPADCARALAHYYKTKHRGIDAYLKANNYHKISEFLEKLEEDLERH